MTDLIVSIRRDHVCLGLHLDAHNRVRQTKSTLRQSVCAWPEDNLQDRSPSYYNTIYLVNQERGQPFVPCLIEMPPGRPQLGVGQQPIKIVAVP